MDDKTINAALKEIVGSRAFADRCQLECDRVLSRMTKKEKAAALKKAGSAKKLAENLASAISKRLIKLVDVGLTSLGITLITALVGKIVDAKSSEKEVIEKLKERIDELSLDAIKIKQSEYSDIEQELIVSEPGFLGSFLGGDDDSSGGEGGGDAA
jgi:ribosomal protein S10